MPRVLAVCTQKGGVGKTTTATNLAAAMVGQYKLKVLVYDLDPQRNTTRVLFGRDSEPRVTIKEMLWQPLAVDEVMQQTALHPDLYVVAGSAELAVTEKHVDAAQWDEIAQEARQTLVGGIPDDIDVVIIDTPPSLGLWLHCALSAADSYLLVGEPAVFSLEGIADFLNTADHVTSNINPELRRAGLVVNKVRPTAAHTQFIHMYQSQFEGELVATIPLRASVEEASLYHPVEFFAGAAPDARAAYRQLAIDMLKHLGVSRKARQQTPTISMKKAEAAGGDSPRRGGGRGRGATPTTPAPVVQHNSSTDVEVATHPVIRGEEPEATPYAEA